MVNGNLFHGQILEPILEDLARVENPKLETQNSEARRRLREILAATWDSPQELRTELWRTFVQDYMAPALREFGAQLGNNPHEQIAAMTQGLGVLARMCADLLPTGPKPGDTGKNPAIRQFLPPEGVLRESIEVDGITVELTGNYDGLWFDPREQQFVLFDFKCKTPAEFPSDFHQIVLYSRLIQGQSSRPVRAVLAYVQPEPEVRHLSAGDLAEARANNAQFVRFVVNLLGTPPNSGAEIPGTAIPDLCRRCPLDARCDALYGQR